jgi:ATP-dependent Lhr-like helicase
VVKVERCDGQASFDAFLGDAGDLIRNIHGVAPVAGLDGDSAELRWWTYAGGGINSTLRYALTALEPTWTVIPDNYAVKVRGARDSGAWLAEAIDRLSRHKFWTNDTFWSTIHASLPNYRLTTFQPLMSD